jgi:FkbM family methyltransferase
MFLFDIGAHFGIFSLAAAHFGGKAIAVDPSPTATRMIARQAALNQCTGRVRILQASVSNQDGAMDMVNAGVLSEGYFQVIQGRSKSELTRTAAVTIDHMTREFGPPTHVKVDVEGHEMAVLLGARATLTRFSPVLFLELHNEIVLAQGNDPTLPLDELARSGYGLFALNGRELSKSAILERPIARIVARRTLGSSLQGEVVSD